MATDSPLVLACGALVSELRAVLAASDAAGVLEIDYLPAPLHNRPDQIVPAIERRLEREHPNRSVVLGYADCGTGGLLDAYIEGSTRPIGRLPGAHCYEFMAGDAVFASLQEREPGTFYLTDFLARNFDVLVWKALRFDAHPELLAMLFGNYQRLVYLAQSDDDRLAAQAEEAARKLGLAYLRVPTGLGPFDRAVQVAFRNSVGSEQNTASTNGDND